MNDDTHRLAIISSLLIITQSVKLRRSATYICYTRLCLTLLNRMKQVIKPLVYGRCGESTGRCDFCTTQFQGPYLMDATLHAKYDTIL